MRLQQRDMSLKCEIRKGCTPQAPPPTQLRPGLIELQWVWKIRKLGWNRFWLGISRGKNFFFFFFEEVTCKGSFLSFLALLLTLESEYSHSNLNKFEPAELESVKSVKTQLKNKLKDYKQRLENVASLEDKRSEVRFQLRKFETKISQVKKKARR